MIRLRSVIRTLAALLIVGAALLVLARSGLPDRIELSQGAPGEGAGLQIGSAAPRFQLLNAAGEQVALDSKPAVVTIVNFWATWCAPCRREMRELQELHSSRPESIRVLAVNMGETADTVAAWRRELGISYDLLLDPAFAVTERYMIRGLPASYLLDSKLRIRHVYYGPVSSAELKRDIQRLTARARARRG